jgi:hypothetical protein
MEARVVGNSRRFFGRIGVVAERPRIEPPAVGLELLELPGQERL